MWHEKAGYARREFLGRCLAAPIAAQAVLSASVVVASDTPSKVTGPVAASAPANLEAEVESLLALVDPRVVYRRVPVPPEKNAWPLWKKAYESYVKQPEDEEFIDMVSRVLDGGDFPAGELKNRLLDWIEKNAECRSLMDEGIKLEAVELPRAEKSGSLSLALDEIDLFRTLAQLRFFTSRGAAETGDFDKAASEAFAGLAFANILLASECLVLDFLVGIAVLGIAVSSVHHFSVCEGAPESLSREWIKRLANSKVRPEVLKRAYRVEYCRWILPYLAGYPENGTTQELVRHYLFGLSEPAPDYKPSEAQKQENDRAVRDIVFLLDGHQNAFDKDATTGLGSDFYLRLFNELDKPFGDRSSDPHKELRNEISAWPEGVEIDFMEGILGRATDKKPSQRELRRARKQLRSVDNVLGKRIVVQFLSATEHSALEMSHARLDSARLRIALHLYERKYRRLPDTLTSLVDDELLPDVPRDPFDGKEFKYSPERRVIWSVGSEGTNEGVIPEKSDPEEVFDEFMELTWRI